MSKNLIYSGIVGTIVYFLLGWLVYGVLFPDLQSGKEPDMVWIFLDYLLYTFFYATILVHLAHIKTLKAGFNTGLVLGVLFGISWHFFLASEGFHFVPFIKEILIGGFTTAIMTEALDTPMVKYNS